MANNVELLSVIPGIPSEQVLTYLMRSWDYTCPKCNRCTVTIRVYPGNWISALCKRCGCHVFYLDGGNSSIRYLFMPKLVQKRLENATDMQGFVIKKAKARYMGER